MACTENKIKIHNETFIILKHVLENNGYKGNIIVVGRKSEDSLYSQNMATFEEDTVYNQEDAEGFIKLNALRLKILKNRT